VPTPKSHKKTFPLRFLHFHPSRRDTNILRILILNTTCVFSFLPVPRIHYVTTPGYNSDSKRIERESETSH
jgi:hypothetical protein